ncbi:uncharacterized protein LOC62_05G007590 [Vanrija pseudolonga]|uniref:Uncharacterized protein n=1 Tax=Vanrija pseudolonga TaxID=143232 RepID=A0AAF0YCS8_9TREE|nr:hypothetical protein LOC62_05G007590 [Vanrija pseudolonga]
MPLIPDNDRPRRHKHHHHHQHAGMIPDADRPPPDVMAPDRNSTHLHKARDVVRALATDRALLDSEYRFTLIRNYLDFKLTHHAREDLGPKMRKLEHEFPEYADTFEAVRAAYDLPLAPHTESSRAHSPLSWFSRTPRTRSRVPSTTSLHHEHEDVFASNGPGAGAGLGGLLQPRPPAYTPAEVLVPLDVNATIRELQRRLEAEEGARRAAEARLGELGVDVPPPAIKVDAV